MGIAALRAARADSSSDSRRHAALTGRIGAAITTCSEEMANRRDGGCEAADAGLDIGTQDNVGDPEGEIRLRLEFVDKGDADHRDDGSERGE